VITLYYAPGACSMAPHVLLEELDLPYETVRIDTNAGQQHTPEFLALNPRARVPVLRTPDGEVLTETIALSTWIARQAPAAGWLPTESVPLARTLETMSFLATGAHAAFTRWVVPQSTDPVRAEARASYLAAVNHLERMSSGGRFATGDRPTIADPYVLVYFLWARHMGLDLVETPWFARWGAEFAARPAVLRVLRREGLIPA
jgi:glutathione S-transferase